MVASHSRVGSPAGIIALLAVASQARLETGPLSGLILRWCFTELRIEAIDDEQREVALFVVIDDSRYW
jgi:hypothetical protein